MHFLREHFPIDVFFNLRLFVRNEIISTVRALSHGYPNISSFLLYPKGPHFRRLLVGWHAHCSIDSKGLYTSRVQYIIFWLILTTHGFVYTHPLRLDTLHDVKNSHVHYVCSSWMRSMLHIFDHVDCETINSHCSTYTDLAINNSSVISSAHRRCDN